MKDHAAFLVQARLRRYDRERRSRAPRLGRLAAGLLSLLVAVGGIWLAFFYSRITQDLPSVEALPALLEPPDGLLLQPTRLYDRTGQHLLLALENPAAAGHAYLPLTPASLPLNPGASTAANSAADSAASGLPAGLVAATLAASDPNFWQHAGYTLQGLAGDTPPDATASGQAALDPALVPPAQHTLAQRLVSNLLLAEEPPSLQRALRERLLAAQATRRFGREKILEWYLNSASYGRLTYGADAAARVYFGKPAGQLTLAEAAVLAAVAEAPDLNPSDAPQAAVERQKYVLKALLDQRLAAPADISQAAVQRLDFRPQERPGQALLLSSLQPQVAPAFAGLALHQLESAIAYAELARGGLNVITSLDYTLQLEAACAANAQLARLESGVPQDAQPACEAARLLPTITAEGASPAAPSAAAAQPAAAAAGTPLTGLTAEVVVLDPATGEILALVGREPVSLQGTPLPPHPVGTIAAPVIYLTAFTRGFSPATLVWDLPPPGEPAADAKQTGATPEISTAAAPDALPLPNLDGRFHGPLRLRSALANDYLQPAEAVLEQVGIENVWRTAAQLGWRQPADPRSAPAASLGLFAPLDLLQVSQAYGVLANRGVLAGRSLELAGRSLELAGRSLETGGINGANPAQAPIQPAAILQVIDTAGRTRLDWRAPHTRPILTPPLAYLVTHILADEAARWPTLGHPNPTETGRAAAVKLGRTPAGDSYWAIGYTPQQVIGVWLGPQAEGPEGASPTPPAAAPAAAGTQLRLASAGLWHALTQYSGRGYSSPAWEPPAGVSLVKVCDPSGMLPTRHCPNVVEEFFLAGSEPIQMDRMYRSLPVNRASQRLATIFTPQDLIEERAYFIVPPQATGWAAGAGLATPPETYDTVPLTLPSAPNAQIASPAPFAILHGRVTITGTADLPPAAAPGATVTPGAPSMASAAAQPAAGFDFYRIQVGQGMYPGQWITVGEDQGRPQPGGPLAVWDTRGLNGLYAVQLIVVLADQSVQRSTVLVTVDNRAPEISLLSPAPGEDIQSARRPRLVLLADVTDDLGITAVTLSLDGRLLATYAHPPYAISWPTQPGSHTFSVTAVDQAGNSSQAEIMFTVK